MSDSTAHDAQNAKAVAEEAEHAQALARQAELVAQAKKKRRVIYDNPRSARSSDG